MGQTKVGRSSCLALTPTSISQEYASHLERQLHFYTEAARRLGYDGSRVSSTYVVDTELEGWGHPTLSTNHPFPRRLQRRHCTGGT